MDYNAPPPDDAELPALIAELIGTAGSFDLDVRRTAIERLYELAFKVGPKAAAAVPQLIAALLDPDPKIGESAGWALKYCAPDSIDDLVACLRHERTYVRERAAQALGNIGEPARSTAASMLRDLLGDEDAAVRQRAAWALGLVQDTSASTVQVLADVAAHGSPGDVAAALHALGNIGKSAGPASLAAHQETILAGLSRPEADARRWALYAAASVGLEAQAWAERLVDLVRCDGSSEVRSAALSALDAVAASVDLLPAAGAIAARLAEARPEASLACRVLGAMRPRPKQVVPLLVQALDRDELVLPVATALWRIEGRAEAIMAALERIFHDEGEGVCDLVCEMGPAASPLLPRLIDALAEDDWDLQWAAADALKALASVSDAAVLPLLDALGHPSPIVRSASARALAATGAASVAPLRHFLTSPDEPRAAWAGYALGEMGPVAADAAPDLVALMRVASEPLSGCCAIAVARIAGDAEAIPHLISSLRSIDHDAPRRAAAVALGEFGPAAASALVTLEEALDDEDSAVADAAAEAIGLIQGVRH